MSPPSSFLLGGIAPRFSDARWIGFSGKMPMFGNRDREVVDKEPVDLDL